MELPPGFRFHPTDEEIITFYLKRKVINSDFSAAAIGEADLNKCEPWDLPKAAKMGEKEWYFFFRRDRKYPTGMRTNRATESGYWKATGKDKEIFSKSSLLIGMKKTLVFYTGRAPKGDKSNWVMHEFRLHGHPDLPPSAKDDWVVSRVFHKNEVDKNKKIVLISPNHTYYADGDHRLLRINSLGVDDMLDPSNSLPPLADVEIIPTPSYDNNNNNNNNNNNIYDPYMNYNNNNSNNNNILAGGNSNYHCKAEQFSISANHSMDTALSTDNYAEISSKDYHFGYAFGAIQWDDL